MRHQAVAFRLADMATPTARLAVASASLKRRQFTVFKEASMAKLFASTMAERVCSDCDSNSCDYGYVSDFPVERIYRDVRVSHEGGASDIQRLVIAVRSG